MNRPLDLVAILTDFGISDPYVGVMKSVILGISPKIRFIDLTHNVAPQNIISASYLLLSAWPYLPEGTVCLSVVDPGVGSERRELIAETGNRYLVTPDNGTVTMLAYEYPNAQYFRIGDDRYKALTEETGASTTFHGRDLFAPVAAEIVGNGFDSVCADPIEPVLLEGLLPQPATAPKGFSNEPERWISANVIHIDHFGNCITSLKRTNAMIESGSEISRIDVPNATRKMFSVETPAAYFSAVEHGAPLAYWGSAGFLELAVREENAAREYGISHMSVVFIRFTESAGRGVEHYIG